MSNAVRSAIGEALGYPFVEEAFSYVDLIEINVRDGEATPEATRHEVAAEMTEAIIDTLTTRQQAVLWAVSSADGEGFERFGGRANDLTSARIRLDLWVVTERAVFAALTARWDADEHGTCRHCGRHIVNHPDDGWIDPEASGDDIVWRETCDEHDTFEARHEPEEA